MLRTSIVHAQGVDPRGTAFFDVDQIRGRRARGVLSQPGRTAEARTAYQEFLEFWKDADPDLPIVQDAKKRLAEAQKG